MKHSLLLLISAIIFSTNIFSQNAQITGTVRDADTKDPMSGASVKFDKSRGAISDASGQFTLNIPAGEHDLTISFVGYKNDKRTVNLKEGEKLHLEVSLRPSAFQMNQVVTVSQYKKNSSKETVTTEVIGKNFIKNTNANDIGEVVNKTSGVLVQDGQISIRGGSSFSYGVGTRTAVLSDGLSLMSADRGEAQVKIAPLENVKQVEVVKGASSVVYGSGALNGVVNVITEWPSDSEPKTEIGVNMGGYDAPADKRLKWWGSNSRFFGSTNVTHQRRFGNLQFVCGGNITYDKSYLQKNDGFRSRLFLKTRYLHPKIEGLNLGINGAIFFERNELFFISQNLDSLALVPANSSDDRHMKVMIDPHLSYTNSKGHSFKSTLRYMNISRDGGTGTDAVSHMIWMDNQYQYRFKKDLFVITAGVPFSVGVSRSNLYVGQHTNFSSAFYTQAEFNYKILALQAGVRYEIQGVDTQIITGRPVFRSGINVQAAKATFIRASWGQGYRVPVIAEKYLAQEFTNGVMIVPNDTLKDESSWSFEIGLRQGFQVKEWKAYIDASFFWQEYKNYIEYQLAIWPNKWGNGTQIFPDSLELDSILFNGPNKVLGAKPLNIENARIAGYEIGIGTSGKIGPVGMQISGGYSYNFPSRKDNDTGSAHYTTGEFLRDVFKFAGKRVGPEDTAHLLYFRSRHLVRADIELSYWKCYVGATFSYGSIPELIPGFFKAAANLIFKDPDALDKYVDKHIKGDFFVDLRAGIKINDHFSLGFIVKNAANHLYSLRPGKPEPLRSYTGQVRYIF